MVLERVFKTISFCQLVLSEVCIEGHLPIYIYIYEEGDSLYTLDKQHGNCGF